MKPMCVIACFVAILFASVPVAAGEMVPFKATIQTEPIPVGDCGMGCLALNITGVGQASHMGRIHIAGPSEVNVITGTQTATSTLTAANGDSITISLSGTVQFEGTQPDDPVHFQGTWTIASGTGRFAGVAGSGTYKGSAAGTLGIVFLTGSISK